MLDQRFTVIKRQFTVATETSLTEETAFDIGAIGHLVFAQCFNSGGASSKQMADAFVQLLIRYDLWKASEELFGGYISVAATNIGHAITWQGKIPVDLRTKVRFAHLQASGESQILELRLVIKREQPTS